MRRRVEVPVPDEELLEAVSELLVLLEKFDPELADAVKRWLALDSGERPTLLSYLSSQLGKGTWVRVRRLKKILRGGEL